MVALAQALTIKIEPHKEECFFENVEKEGVKVSSDKIQIKKFICKNCVRH